MSITRNFAVSGTDGASANTLTIPFGVTATAGDRLILVIGSANGSGLNTPSGYTLLGRVDGGSGGLGGSLSVYHKIATGVETSVTITGSGTTYHLTGYATGYTATGGAISIGNFTSATTGTTGIDTAPAWPSLPATNVVAIACVDIDLSSTFATPDSATSGSGWTEVADQLSDNLALYGRSNFAAAENTTETLAQATFTITVPGSSNGGAVAMFYVYEPTGGHRSKLLMSL